MLRLSPFSKKTNNPEANYFDDSKRLSRILYRFNAYVELFGSALKKGIPLNNLLLGMFPFAFRDAEEPPIVALELTNYCNLKCPYCTSPLGLRKRGYMSDEVFDRIIDDLNKMKPNRIQLVGNGESTLHPNFGRYLGKLGRAGKFVSIVTNGQWKRKETVNEILNSGIDLVEFSIDAGGKEKYEASRINGNYERLISNIKQLSEQRNNIKSKTIILVRVMLRPSEKNSFEKEKSFWSKYADRVMPQYLTKINNMEYEEDLFITPNVDKGLYPKCSMPFKHMEVKYTGEVLMCYYTAFQLGGDGLRIGNVLDMSLNQLWNCQIMKDYRLAHRKRLKDKMPACKGCVGT